LESQTAKQIRDALKGKQFEYGVDLGCGFGEYVKILRAHCKYLVGMDRTLERVMLSGYNIYYDELVLDDWMTYEIPAKADAVFWFDGPEHLSMEESLNILNRIGARYCMISTPSKFYPYAFNGHASLWSVENFEKLGFRTVLYSCGYWRQLLYGMKILAVKEGSRL